MKMQIKNSYLFVIILLVVTSQVIAQSEHKSDHPAQPGAPANLKRRDPRKGKKNKHLALNQQATSPVPAPKASPEELLIIKQPEEKKPVEVPVRRSLPKMPKKRSPEKSATSQEKSATPPQAPTKASKKPKPPSPQAMNASPSQAKKHRKHTRRMYRTWAERRRGKKREALYAIHTAKKPPSSTGEVVGHVVVNQASN